MSPDPRSSTHTPPFVATRARVEPGPTASGWYGGPGSSITRSAPLERSVRRVQSGQCARSTLESEPKESFEVGWGCRCTSRSRVQVAVLHSSTAPLARPTASHRPSGLNAGWPPGAIEPISVTGFQVERSHTRATPASETVAAKRPSAVAAAVYIRAPPWASITESSRISASAS